MSTVYSVKKGLDIKLLGEAEKTVVDLDAKRFAIKPPDFIGCFPKMLLKEGDSVKAGTPLFFDKYRENITYTSPVSGKFVEIKRGAKRKILELIIESDGKFESIDFGSSDTGSLDKQQATEKLLKSGVWPLIRQRPYSVVANPDDSPKSIFVSAYSSAPLAPDYELMIKGNEKALQAGFDVLAKLTPGKVHLNIHAGLNHPDTFKNVSNVQVNTFSGPHPSGNVSVQASRLNPINKGDVIWYTDVQGVITIGKLFLTGKYDSSRMIALAGSEVLKPRYYRAHAGANITNMVVNNVSDSKNRFISGDVLTGTKIESDGFIGF